MTIRWVSLDDIRVSRYQKPIPKARAEKIKEMIGTGVLTCQLILVDTGMNLIDGYDRFMAYRALGCGAVCVGITR